MSTVRYPGPDLPAPTAIKLDLPDGWSAHPAPGVAFVATPAADDPPAMSLVGSVRRVDGAVTMAELADSISEEIARVDAITLVERTSRDVGPDRCEVLTFELRHDGGVIRQTKALWLADVGGGLSDAVTVTLSYPGDADDAQLDQLGSIIDSVRIGAAGSRPHSEID